MSIENTENTANSTENSEVHLNVTIDNITGTVTNNLARKVRFHTDNMKPDNNDHRLCVLTWKAPQEGKRAPAWWPQGKKPESRCVSVPRLNITIQPACLQIAMNDAYASFQDSLIRKLVEDHITTNGNADLTLTDQQIDEYAVTAYQAETATGFHLSGDLIDQWFDAHLAAALVTKFVTKLTESNVPQEQQDKQINGALVGYKATFRKLSSPTASMDQTKVDQLLGAINLSPSAAKEPVGEKITAKLNKLSVKTETALMDIA